MLFKSWKSKIIAFLISQGITLFGSTLVQMAIVWYVALQTSSGVWVAAFTVCSYLPQFLISFAGGAWADRHSRKKLIIYADAVIAAATLALFLAVPYLRDNDVLLGTILAVSIVRSLGAGIQTPAVNATVSQLVPAEKLMRYNGINSTIQTVVQFAAPAAAGAILSFLSLKWTFLIDVATAVVGIGLLSVVAIPKTETEIAEKKPLLEDVKNGLKYSFTNPLLRKLLISFGIFIFLTVPAGFLSSLFVSREYGDNYWYLTLVEVVGFIGMTVGGLLMSTWGGFKKSFKTLDFGILAFGILAIGMGAVKNLIVYLVLMAIYGIALTMVQTATTTMLQKNAEPSKQGSVFGVMSAIYSGILPIGMVVFGPLADYVDLRWLMVASGVFLVPLAVWALCSKTLREN